MAGRSEEASRARNVLPVAPARVPSLGRLALLIAFGDALSKHFSAPIEIHDEYYRDGYHHDTEQSDVLD